MHVQTARGQVLLRVRVVPALAEVNLFRIALTARSRPEPLPGCGASTCPMRSAQPVPNRATPGPSTTRKDQRPTAPELTERRSLSNECKCRNLLCLVAATGIAAAPCGSNSCRPARSAPTQPNPRAGAGLLRFRESCVGASAATNEGSRQGACPFSHAAAARWKPLPK
eukprot:1050884-Rhodomonas_salina.4